MVIPNDYRLVIETIWNRLSLMSRYQGVSRENHHVRQSSVATIQSQRAWREKR
jgi:hypothetical protein